MPASDNGVHTTRWSYLNPYLIPPAPTALDQLLSSMVSQLHPQEGKEKLHLCNRCVLRKGRNGARVGEEKGNNKSCNLTFWVCC